MDYIDRRRQSAIPAPLILVVDDDAGSRRAMADVLREFGYAVESAADGAAAIELARDTRPDLVISDVCMPKTDGFELASTLRTAGSKDDYTPIILVSGRDNVERRVTGLDLGADDYLAKPVDADELLARVRVHLRNANRHRVLLERTLMDDLTGVLNRRGIMQALAQLMQRYRQNGLPVSVMMVDIDSFKTLNDTYGHTAGDTVLRRVAASLRTQTRGTDQVGRYGGDEFLVLLPGIDRAEASRISKRLRKMAELPAWPDEPGGRSVTISTGSATATADDTVRTLIDRADHAMYVCKGRKLAG
jgi:diguanylate cyclase (GGDEF)-like protein